MFTIPLIKHKSSLLTHSKRLYVPFNYVSGIPGWKTQRIFTEIVDEFPKKCEANYFGKMKSWTKPEIEIAILNIIMDNTDEPLETVTMNSNLATDLSMNRPTRFAVQDEIQNVFQFRIPFERLHARDVASAKEASDWVASIMEEFNRLLY